jgi:hypothetical protein
MRISREAVGDLTLIASEVEYGRGSGSTDGLPPGTRGGMAVTHDFPLDARYRFTVGAARGCWSRLSANKSLSHLLRHT